MERLTKKIVKKLPWGNGSYYTSNVFDCGGSEKDQKERYELLEKSIDKLGALEDMEEELGCPLEVYTKATLGRFWVEDEQKWHSLQDSLIIKKINGEYAWCIGHDMTDYRLILLKDYKKTWWLKEDRSE